MRRNLFNNENPMASSQDWSVDAIEYSRDYVCFLPHRLHQKSIINKDSLESYCEY